MCANAGLSDVDFDLLLKQQFSVTDEDYADILMQNAFLADGDAQGPSYAAERMRQVFGLGNAYTGRKLEVVVARKHTQPKPTTSSMYTTELLALLALRLVCHDCVVSLLYWQ